MELKYTGPALKPGQAIPLPEHWPAADHDEPDEELAKAKVESGNYKYAKPTEPKAKADGKEGAD